MMEAMATAFVFLFALHYVADKNSFSALALPWDKQVDGFQSLVMHTKAHTLCRVAVLGGGVAGTFAAYMLASKYPNEVCLIEAEDYIGGRIYDVAEMDGGPVWGMGALRVIDKNMNMNWLAKELGIKLQFADVENELIKVRGQIFMKNVAEPAKSQINILCREMFVNLSWCNGTESADMAMYAELQAHYSRLTPAMIDEYADFKTYVASVLGDEGLQFLKAVTRYNSLFDHHSLRGIMDFLRYELSGRGLDPKRAYPEGGMSQFPNLMMKSAVRKFGARLFLNTPVLRISYARGASANGPYQIESSTQIFEADKILVAIDPVRLPKVRGDIADQITSSPLFRAIKPVKLSITAAWWPERWWYSLPLQSKIARIVSHENCFSTMDIPTFAYGIAQNVTRGVYDDGACVPLWEQLMYDPAAKAAGEMMKGLKNAVFGNVTIPRPKKTQTIVWPHAWYFQHSDSPYSNVEISDFALLPLPDHGIALIGDGYNPRFTSWCEGAVLSAMQALAAHFSFHFSRCKCGEAATVSPCMPDLNCDEFASPPAKRNKRSISSFTNW